MTETVVLHVGTHKTGSTSLQQFLHDERAGLLADAGVAYPTGLVIPTSHAELPLLSIRPERTWPARLRFPETQDPRWLDAAKAHVRATLGRAPQPITVLSHEDLSYVRHDDEVVRLRTALGERAVRVVVFFREPVAFLRSYRAQLEATGFEPSDDPTSFAHVEPDSWLVDRDALVAVLQRGFGTDAVEALDYDATVARDGSVIPVFAELLGIPRSSLPTLDGYHLNRSGSHLRPNEEQLAAIRRRLAEQAR